MLRCKNNVHNDVLRVETLVALITDPMNLSAEECEKLANLSESIVVEEDHTGQLGS